MGYAKIHLKKESIGKNRHVSKRRKKKEKKRKKAHDLYAHA
jgi:hypothetical protein